VAPTYWLNEKNGVTYPIAVADAPIQINSLPALQNLPINAGRRTHTVLGRHRGHAPHDERTRWSPQYDIAPMVEI